MANTKRTLQGNKRYKITNGNPVQKVNVTHGCSYYRVDLRHSAIGKAVCKNFTTAQKAGSFARKTMAGAFSDLGKKIRAVDTLREAMEILNPFNISLSEAARFYAKYHGAGAGRSNMANLIREYITDKEAEVERGKLQETSLENVRHVLKLFSMEYGHRAVDLITPGELDCFLENIKGTAKRRSCRLYLSEFFNWAVAKGSLKENPVRKTRRETQRRPTPQIYRSSAVARLMRTADPELIPYLALSFFSGARSTEILGLVWKDLNFERGEIRIRPKNAVNGIARTLTIQQNLVQFLVAFRGSPNARVVPHEQRGLQRRIRQLFTQVGIKSINQGFRHTFATYHLALHPIVETAHELGCRGSESLFKYCRINVKNLQKQAEGYFSIAPQRQGEIIPLEQEAA